MSPAALRRQKTAKAAAAQRRAAEPQTSVWVAASAGTGKTKVLTDRLVRLQNDSTMVAVHDDLLTAGNIGQEQTGPHHGRNF